MSADGVYLLVYECHNYAEPSPMEKDKKYLLKEHWGRFIQLDEFLSYWEKPKSRLDDEDYENLCADQILESVDGNIFTIIR